MSVPSKRLPGARRRRTYELTGAGRRALTTERSEWRDFAAVIEGVVRPGASPA